jgi:hypothetical protein
MPRKPRAPAQTGVAWDPEIYDIVEFVYALNDLRRKAESTMVPSTVMEQLARLARARVFDNEIFQAGITFSVQSAHEDFPILSTSLYREDLVDRIVGVEEAARRLQKALQEVENPEDRTALWVGRAIRAELNPKARETKDSESNKASNNLSPLAPHLCNLSALIEASGKAKRSVGFARTKGAPAGAAQGGMALTRWIHRVGCRRRLDSKQKHSKRNAY